MAGRETEETERSGGGNQLKGQRRTVSKSGQPSA